MITKKKSFEKLICLSSTCIGGNSTYFEMKAVMMPMRMAMEDSCA